MSHYALPHRGGSVASPYAAGYDYGPRRSHRYPSETPLYASMYPQRVPYHRRPARAPAYFRESNVFFEEAMDHLYGTLTEAVNFFKDFDDAFAQETSGIKPYATGPILNKLWQNKVLPIDKARKGHSARRTTSDGSESDEASGSGQQEEAFREHLKRVLDDMNQTLIARAPFPKNLDGRGGMSRSEIDSMDRLRGMLEGQYEKLHRISSNVYNVRRYLQEFIKEADVVVHYMDQSRELWDFGHERAEKEKENEEGSQDGSNPEESTFGE
ncbi:conserved hypothetical protein [Paecilomyces variotii No. 5]|uniref:Uncharacterized protein n=1 Tax=Byssochlamys spectabilis (strain No. 5 / NBRC 109023) TaxID=1356009 RepID=V5GDD7_BYSSN|nr:conserved hypothetical protein [Paecilomyces variotii No. 5]